ncbi:MAG TPA: DnaJ domain-containing protein, partial [Methylomirabilota bacterium]|nr:DnaJ domain-containing protein [Methylomirabilota bacterium]
MAAKDYYGVLGVPRNADDAALKKAYRNLARAYHPDRNPGDRKAEDRFKEISEAYSVLSDPEKRAQYDRFGVVGAPGAGDVGFGTIFEDLFEGFFGG